MEGELEQGALLDAVTGLPSRTLILDRLAQAQARRLRTGAPFAVMFAVTDGVDEVRRQFGRERADAVLAELGSQLMAAVRPGDSVGRYSEGEFIVVCEDLGARDQARAIADRILELGEFTTHEEGVAVDIRITLGFTVAAAEEDSPAILVQRADAAAHQARVQGAKLNEYPATPEQRVRTSRSA